MKMGPLSKMAGMIPGLSNLMGDVGDEEGGMKLKRMMYIMDSMTDKELDSDGKIFVQQPERMTRIARGSGTSVREVEDVLTQHKMMAQMAKKMKGGMKAMQQGGMGRGGAPNPQQLAAMQKRMQAMGAGAPGPGGMDMASMMRALGGGGGPGGPGGMGGMDMNKMMSQMASMFGGGGPPRR